jgi:hypothetical protein
MKADDLNADARELIAAGRDGAPPGALVRARVQRSVQNRLAAGMSVAAMSYAPSVLGAASAKAGALLVVAAAVAAGSWAYRSTNTTEQLGAPPEPPRAVVAQGAVGKAEKQAEPEPAPAPEPEKPVPASAPASAPPAPAGRREPPKSSAQGRLAEEIGLLSKASAALNRGQTARAAQLLGEYDKLGSNRLIEERSATGVLVLCSSGQVARAQAAAERFFKRFPRSPLASRVQASCAGDSSRR